MKSHQCKTTSNRYNRGGEPAVRANIWYGPHQDCPYQVRTQRRVKAKTPWQAHSTSRGVSLAPWV